MTKTFAPRSNAFILSLLAAATLTACGGGGGGSATGAAASAPVGSASPDTTAPVSAAPATPESTAGNPILNGRTAYGESLFSPQNVGAVLTDVKFENTGATAQLKVPVTFGQVFPAGALGASEKLVGKLANGTVVQLQMDVKATHPDGSVRHAVLSAVLPSLAAGETVTMNLAKGTYAASTTAVTAAQLASAGFSAKVTLNVAGQTYTVAAEDLLKTGTPAKWLTGAVANEWTVSAPLRNASGAAHPHLTARFDVRAYTGLSRAKVDVVVENNWAYETAPGNITYDANVTVGGKTVYTKAGLNHYHHARWKKSFWWGATPQVHVRHNVAYLIGSRAVANYDKSVVPAADALAWIKNRFTGALTEPMSPGMATAYMPTGGGRPDLGLLPGWAVAYLLSQDKDVKNAMMGTADLAGSFSIHYRDKQTDRVISVQDYPYMTIMGRSTDTYNPVTRKYESFPACAGSCDTPLTADSSHQPNSAYLPYVVSGDRYYLEELQFWTMYNVLQHNPGYRDAAKGLVHPDQIRGQAWSMRNLAETAWITPNADPLKSHFDTFLSNNLDYYNNTYSNNPTGTNALGALVNSNAMVYDGGLALAPWQDDFFTMAIGRAAELGYAKAQPLLAWKSKYPVERMTGNGMCWISASMYKMVMRSSTSGPVFTTMADAYKASHPLAITSTACASAAMATALKLKTGEMEGFEGVIDGYPAYMQPALAYATASGNPNAAKAWNLFMARPYKPNYSQGAQFAILPR